MFQARLIHCRAFSRSSNLNGTKRKQKQLVDLIMPRGQSNIDRAFQHFDDFYSSVHGSKWPSMRLGLICPQKYIAVPNNFSDIDGISATLESLGAFDLRNVWKRGKEKLKGTNPQTGEQRQEESKNLEALDQTLESIARTKQAEEIDTLYKNAPTGKVPVPLIDDVEDSRLITHVQEASLAFVPSTKLKGIEDYEFESEYFSSYAQANTPSINEFTFTTNADAPVLSFPSLRPYTFEGGSDNNFPSARRNKDTGLRDWICINGASLAPIMALDLTPEINLLDLCAGPGTKSLLALMTLCPSELTANDLEASRVDRIRRLFLEFTGNARPDNVRTTKRNAINYPASHEYDRVLADVPCSSDRVSATISENSIFQPRRLKERINIVKTQKSILLAAFRSLSKTSGSVCVYSTCTLSPIENDGAVGTALRETDERDLVVDIEGLWQCLLPFEAMNLFFLSRTKFGVLIEPNVFANSGPMFVSRILRRPSSPHQTYAE